MNKFRTVIALGVVFSLAGCATSVAGSGSASQTPEPAVNEAKASILAEASKSPTPSSSSPVTRTVVIWSDYEVGTQNQIDQYTKLSDCRGLQSYVGMATATEASVKAKTGHGNDALLKYIGESMVIAGCS